MPRSTIKFKKLLLVIFFFSLHTLMPASDHIDGPVTTGHAVADITGLFAFPSPDHPGKMTLIMNLYPGVGSNGHFSDKVTYSFIIKHTSINGLGSTSGFSTSGNYRISCTFETPHDFANSPHWITCKTSNGSSIRVQVDETNGFSSNGSLGAFAGHRSDPFFFNPAFAIAAAGGKLKEPKNFNVMKDLNTLSIVVVIDIEKELGLDQGSLFAIAAETTTQDGNITRQIDRIGRPEITNITMTNNGRQELRDLYNAQKPFDLSGKNVELFRQRLRDNIAFYDSLNNSLEWTTQTGNHLAEILLNDFLVVDVSKPFTKDTYFDIEYSILKGDPYTTCGGRVPNDDIIDVIFTMLINGGNKPPIRDGTDQPGKLATEIFPYLASPNVGIVASVKSFIVRTADQLTVSKSAFWFSIMKLLSGILPVIGGILLIYFFIRQGISRMTNGEYAEKKHMRLFFWGAVLFGLGALLGIITSVFSIGDMGILAVISAIMFYFYFKWKKSK